MRKDVEVPVGLPPRHHTMCRIAPGQPMTFPTCADCELIDAATEQVRADIREAVDALGRDSTQTRRTLISSVLTAIDDPHRYI